MAREKRAPRPQSFIEGAMILLAATLVVKCIGVFYKIPLTKILGGTGMGYYMTAYGLFTPVYALAVSGLPVAVSKQVADESAKGHARNARWVFHLSLGLFLLLGAVGSAVLWLGSGWFAELVGNPPAALAVKAVAPAVFFCCLQAAFRGYNEGLRNMVPTALSQMLEALVKLLAGVYFSARAVHWGLAQYRASGTVLGVAVSGAEEALSALLPVAAAGAILGVTLGSAVGSLLLAARHLAMGRPDHRQMLFSPPPEPTGVLLRALVAVAVPVCLAGFAVNLSGFIDLVSVMNRLELSLAQDAGAVLICYPGLAQEGLSLSELPNYLYGCYTGLALTVYNLVPALVGVLGTSALPVVAASWAVQDRTRTCKNARSILRVSCLVAIPAGLGVSALSGPILSLLFSSRPMEVAIATPLLRVLGIAAVFAAVTLPVNSMLQAVGRADLPVKYLVLGGFLKLLCNLFFMSVPEVNLRAAPYGTLLCYGVIACLSLRQLCRITGTRLEPWPLMGKPLLAAVGCCAAASALLPRLQPLVGNTLGTLVSIALGALVYGLGLLLLRTVTREDLERLPMGEKVAEMLEKHWLLG